MRRRGLAIARVDAWTCPTSEGYGGVLVPNDLDLTIRVSGPATTGLRLPLADVARITGEFQAALERLALVALGVGPRTGRRPREVVDAVRLELIGLVDGSAILTLDRSTEPSLDNLLEEALTELETGVNLIARGEPPPATFSTGVLDGLGRLSAGISEGRVTAIDVHYNGRRLMHIDKEFRGLVRVARQRRFYDEATVVGRLHMADFAPSCLRARIDTLDSSILCTFDESLREPILAALDQMVVAQGSAEYLAGTEIIRALDLTRIDPLRESQRQTLAELAAEQGVSALSDPAHLSLGERLPDEEFTSFFSAITSARASRD